MTTCAARAHSWQRRGRGIQPEVLERAVQLSADFVQNLLARDQVVCGDPSSVLSNFSVTSNPELKSMLLIDYGHRKPFSFDQARRGLNVSRHDTNLVFCLK